MDVIPETGEGVEGANSYVSTEEFRTFAQARGFTIPCDNEDLRAFLFRAMDYIESHESRFTGCKTLSTQVLAYPRESSYVGNTLIANNVIPNELKQAQMYAMLGLYQGFDPMANQSSEPFVTREQVDVLRVDYSVESQYNRNRLTMVDTLLSLLTNSGSMIRFVKA